MSRRHTGTTDAPDTTKRTPAGLTAADIAWHKRMALSAAKLEAEAERLRAIALSEEMATSGATLDGDGGETVVVDPDTYDDGGESLAQAWDDAYDADHDIDLIEARRDHDRDDQ